MGFQGFQPDEKKVIDTVNVVDKSKNGALEFEEFCEFLKLAKKTFNVEDAVANQLQASCRCPYPRRGPC